MKHERSVQRVDFLVEQCADKVALHLGCTNWPYTSQSFIDDNLLHATLRRHSKRLYGIDSDRQGIDQLRELGFDDLYLADLEKLDQCRDLGTFDVVIAGEVIEHLNNPGVFLQGVKRFLRKDSRFVLTTINAYCAMRYAIYALRGKGGTNEPVHPDHVAYYSYSTLQLLLERHSFKVVDFRFYDVGREHRIHNRFLVNALNDVSVRLFPQLSDGLIFVCELDE